MPIDKDELSPDEAHKLLSALLDGDMKRLSLLRSILINPFGTSLLRRQVDSFLPKIMERLNLMILPAANATDDSPIEDLGLDTKTTKCLRRGGIHTIGQLRDAPDRKLLDIRQIGQERVDEARARVRMIDTANADTSD